MQHIEAMEALLGGDFGKPFTRKEFDAHCRRQYYVEKEKEKGERWRIRKKIWEEEIERLYAKRQAAKLLHARQHEDNTEDEHPVVAVPRKHR
jgi:hypothetical protein